MDFNFLPLPAWEPITSTTTEVGPESNTQGGGGTLRSKIVRSAGAVFVHRRISREHRTKPEPTDSRSTAALRVLATYNQSLNDGRGEPPPTILTMIGSASETSTTRGPTRALKLCDKPFWPTVDRKNLRPLLVSLIRYYLDAPIKNTG